MQAFLTSSKTSWFTAAGDTLEQPVHSGFCSPAKMSFCKQRLSPGRRRQCTRSFATPTFSAMLLAAALFGMAPRVQAVVVNPGDVAPLAGTTVLASPHLAGPVQTDPLRPFEIFDNLGNLILTGNLQDRVARSDTLGTLIFGPRLLDLDNHGSGAFVTGLRIQAYGGVSTDIDFRTDSLGDVGPNDVSRTTGGGDELTFRYDPNLINPPQEAHFLSILTDASSFAPLGTITIFAQNDFGANVFSTTLIGTNGPIPDTEVDAFPDTRALVGIMMPDGSMETLSLRGPSVAEVHLARLADTDGNGREQVPTELVQLELTGISPILGPVTLRLRDAASPPFKRSTGEIEENANNTSERLDIPPFAETGTANSFFDIFFEVVVMGQVFHSQIPSRMESTISHKPPGPGTTYNKPPGVIPLFDEAGNDTGIKIVQASHEPNPGQVEVDIFPDSFAVLDIIGPQGITETVTVTGPTTVAVEIFNVTDSDGDGREQVPTEIVALELRGESALFGPLIMRLRDVSKDPFMRSTGEIEERINNQPGRLDLPPFAAVGAADSFFDVFFEVEVAGAGLLLHNQVPKRMRQVITYKPPLWGQFYENFETIELYDENNQPSGIVIGANRHVPDPVEVDFFPGTLATMELFCVGQPVAETIALGGPTTVEVDLAAIADSDGNSREQVPTEIVAMQLTGTSSFGPVILRQSPERPSTGVIEEIINNTPGMLDLPPFTPAGTADSFFDLFFEIELPDGLILHNEDPKRMSTVISHKPPTTGDVYEGLDEIALFDPNGNPTGCYLGAGRHIPVCPAGLDVDQDGIPDACDNCIRIPNGPLAADAGGNSQRDTDGDGYGNICDPDFTNNLNIDFADLAYMKSVFFTPDPHADLDGDGKTDFADLAIMKSMFFGPPGPSGLVP